jgi:hypothetical protein
MCMTFQSLVARSAAQNGAVKKDFRALGSEAELSRPSLTPTQSFVRVRAGNTGPVPLQLSCPPTVSAAVAARFVSGATFHGDSQTGIRLSDN